ncbi:hypothetical protein Taro_048262 [Colocasia esculenta]|uniref:Integrase catalytic domain-containing protein n=1 Tax=Colocasia esculenta TaxID=4460 RepID=A0A843X856_COLES|nr:hypothetical protein [Colocasia esculenta]
MRSSVFLSVFTDSCVVSLTRLRPDRGRRTQIKFVIGLTGLNEAFHHNNGQVEATNKTLIEIVKKACEANKFLDWLDKFMEALWTYYTSTRTPMGQTLFAFTNRMKEAKRVKVGGQYVTTPASSAAAVPFPSQLLDPRSLGFVVGVHAVEGLDEGEQQQHHGGDEGDDGPRVAEVVVLEAGAPGVPPLVVVPVHLPRQRREIAVVYVEHHLLAQAVEQVRHLLVVAQPVLDDPTVVQVAHVVAGVDEVVHEDDVGGDVVGGVHVALLEGDQRLGAVVDQQPRHPQYPVAERDVPEPVRLPPPELYACLPQLRHTVHQLLPAFVGHAAGVRPPPSPHLWRRPRPRAQQAPPEHVEAVEAPLSEWIEHVAGHGSGPAGGGLLPQHQLAVVPLAEGLVGGHEGVEEADGQAGNHTALLRLPDLEAEQAIEDEERDLVLQHDHVALDAVHRAAHGEDGIVPGVAQRRKALPGGAPEELQHEAAVEHHGLHELVAGHGHPALEAGAGVVLKCPHGVEVKPDVVAGAAEDHAERPPFVVLHLAEPLLAAVEGADGHHLGDVGLLVPFPQRLGHAVDGQLRPGTGRLVLSRLLQPLPDGDNPFGLRRRRQIIRWELWPPLVSLQLQHRGS